MTPASRDRANVFTIAPGVPLLPTFARALLEGRIVAGVSRECDPFVLARAKIYVPTQRARRALIAALADAAHGATLLPRIAALGALDEEAEQEDDALAAIADVPPAVDALERRLLLTQLVLKWTERLPGAIVSADAAAGVATDHARPLLVGTSPADAFALAGDLAHLVDEFIIENIDPGRLADLAGAEHDPYWQITTRFLAIAFAQWPKILEERGAIDAAARRVRLAAIETARLASAPSPDPVIVLGSTGTNDATARLMAAICRMRNGAVVLPGLDQHMPDAVFDAIGQPADDAAEPAFGHPQAALKRLLATLGVARGNVIEIAPQGLGLRARIVSEALRPAEATADWHALRASLADGLPSAFDGVTLLEASDEREEALAIAVRLRKVLEEPGGTAALVTPDRTLARRVRSELRRWNIDIEDSAGEPLAAAPPGVLARLILAAADEATDASLLALLANPLATLGRDRADVARLARKIEAGVFRAGFASKASWATRVESARTAAKDARAHPAARRISDADWAAIAALLGDLQGTLQPLRQMRKAPLADWVATHRDAVARIGDAVTQTGDAVTTEPREQLAALFDEPALKACALALDAREYRALFDRLTSARVVPPRRDTHPRLKILGLLEARLLDADLVILGGLDETIWPPVARTDAFLNRPMRVLLGLTPPERRIGQTAHDFWMATGAGQVLLTRARKRGGSPTTPSRFLQRLDTLSGAAMTAARERGHELTSFARKLDTPASYKRLPQPQPRPPVALRPRKLSVTRIEKWIRDPYAIFAEQILGLTALGALDEAPGLAEQGTAIHQAVEWATRTFGTDALPADALRRLTEQADELLAAMQGDESWRAFRRPRQMKGLDFFLAYHRARQPALATVHAEVRGRLDLLLSDGSSFTLTGTVDRVEIGDDDALRLVDFKTGSPPSPDEIKADLAPQLTLEAVMAEAGALNGVPARAVTDALYLKLGTRDGGKEIPLKFGDRTFAEVVARHRDLLRELAEAYRVPTRGYPSRPIAKYALRYSDYDHLARVKEWSATSGVASDL